MKTLIYLIAFFLLSLAACKKTNTEPHIDPPPVVTDSAKQENPDTAYLRKSDLYYAYDISGTNIIDSALTFWTYDSKGRPLVTVRNGFGSGSVDSVFSSYGVNTRTNKTILYHNNSLYYDLTSVTFLNASGNPDSMISTSHYYDGTPSPQYSFYYYHYNEKSQDTLENGYTVVNNISGQFFKNRLTYANNFLDSSISYFGDTTAVWDIKLFDANNLTREIQYMNGAVWVNITYTHYDILSGGFYEYLGDRQLTQSVAQDYPGSPVDNRTDDYTYTFDSSHRVIAMNRSQKNIILQKDFFSYY
jgi:hypothetical protein